MKTLSLISKFLVKPTTSVKTIDILIDKKEYDILTKDYLCMIDEVDFVKIIDTTTQTPLLVVETTQPTITLLPRKVVSKFFSRVWNRFTVLPLTMPLCLLMMLGLFAGNGWGQVSITTAGSAVTQNFNGIGTSATATLPAGFKMGTDWSTGATATTQAAGTSGTGILSSSSAGGFYNFANGVTGSSTDRAIGFLTTGSYSSPRSIIYAFTNNTGSTVTSISLSWNYEKYRSGSRAFDWTFFHGSTSTAATANTSGDQSYAADANNTTISNPPTSTAKSFTISSLSIANGSTYYLRWTYTGSNGSTNAQGLGIDDFSITLTVPTAPAAPTISSITPGNQQLSVAFTAGSDGGSAITNYKYSTNGGTNWQTRSPASTASPLVISTLSTDGTTALTNGTSYNVQIRAVNAVGDGTATASTAATPRTTPSAPTITGITPGNQQLSVAFTAGSDGGSAITNYKYSTNGGTNWQTRSPASTASPLVISTLSTDGTTALTNGVSYDIQIRAVNEAGDGTATGTTQGTPAAPVSPTLNAVTLITALSTTYGTASTGISFTASGSNLTAENIMATAQSGYEVSTSSGSGYGSSVSVASGTTVYVRFASTYSAGTYNSATAVVLSGGGASSSADVTTSSSGNTVSQKALTIIGLTAQNKVYDGLTTASATGTAALSGIVGADVVSLTGTPTYTFASANVGTGISVSTSGYSLTGAQSGNYTLTQPSFTANITARSLTVTANNVSKYAGVALTGGAGSTAFTSSGLQNSETIGSVTITYGSAGEATGDGNTVGVYSSQVTPSAATGGTFNSSNYSITYVAGSITVLETPVKIAGWDFNGLTSYGVSPLAASNTNSNSSVGGLTRASGFTTGGTAASSAWGGVGNGTATFTVKANAGYSLSLAEISTYNIRRSSTGATTGQWSYSLDGTNYTNIGSAITWGNTTDASGNAQSAISLIGISALQNLSSLTTVTFRIVNTGATTGTWYLNNFQTGDDFIVQGYVKSVPQLSTPTATSIATTSATLGATIASDGGASITARGTVYGTSASPTTNSFAEGGTSVEAFLHSRTGLTANTFYYYRGYATNSVGTGYSADGTFTTLHNAPTVGSGSNATATTIDASWTAPSGGSEAFTYEIQVDNDSDFSSPTFTQSNISSGTTTLTATGLTSNTTYYFRVRANNVAGNSAWSSTSSGDATLAAVTPTLSGTSLNTFGNVCINTTTSPNSFTINGSALTSADVTVSSLSGFTFSTTAGGTYTGNLTLSQAGGTYAQDIYVKFSPTAVQSYDGNIVIGGGGATSVNVASSGSGIAGSVSVTTTAASSITSSGASTGGSSVSTTCGTITAKGVAYGTSANPTTPVTSDGTGTGNFTSTLSGLTPNTLYNYRAYATNSNSVTSYGSNLTFTTLHNAPTVGTGSNPETTGFTANWSTPTGGGSEAFTYEVAVSTSSTFATFTSQTGIASGSTSYQLTGLSNGTTYYFRVRVNNAGGSSDWSAISSGITTLTPWENFEIGTKSSYGLGDVTFNSGSWSLTDALSVTTDPSDREFGTKSIRIRSTGNATMNFDVTNGISSLTLYHALYGTDASSTWRLEVSNNAGSSWDAYVSYDITTSSTTLTAQTFNVDLCGSLRFRIVKRSGTTSQRINFDDIVLVEKAATPSAPTASPQSFCSASSPTVASLTATGSNIQWYDASTNGNLLSSGTSLATGTYYASQTVSGCESTTRTSVTVTINSSGTWIGDSNDDWNDAANWCGGVPNSSSAVVSIPSGVTVNLDASPSVLNLTIDLGAMLVANGQTITVASGGSFTNNGTYSVGSGAANLVFDGAGTIGGTTVTLNNLTANGALTINTSPTVNGTVTINTGGSITNNPIIYGASSTLIYNPGGEIATTNNEWPTSNSPLNVTIQNASNVTLNGARTINGILTLTSGDLIIGANNLTLGSSATVSSASASSHVVALSTGELRKIYGGNGSFVFPVGDGTKYTPATVNFTAGISLTGASDDYVGVRLKTSKVTEMNNLNTNYINRSWFIEPGAGLSGYTYTVNLSYDGGAGGDVVGTESEIRPVKRSLVNSAYVWQYPGNASFSDGTRLTGTTGEINVGGDVLSWAGLTSFSEFGGGGEGKPLPVELLSFSAECIENQNVLYWQTASEHNTSHFEIEKSTDGINWRVIGQVAAAVNSNELLSYSFVDIEKSNSLNTYYQLNQLDIDGNNEYFGPVVTSCFTNKFDATTLPNPSDELFYLKIDSEDDKSATFVMKDLNGAIVKTQNLELQKGNNTFLIDDKFPTGIYFIEITSQKGLSKIIKHFNL